MLSRVADSLYWMMRYIERAENLARVIDVTWHLTLDMPGDAAGHWQSLITATGDNRHYESRHGVYTRDRVIAYLMFDSEYANAVVSCLRAARENARSVREIISADFWEQINAFYHFVRRASQHQDRVFDNPAEFCKQIRLRGMMMGGISAQTMNHGEGYHFCRMGRYLERADKTSRILDVKYMLLAPGVGNQPSVTDDVHWAALLRTTGGFNAYRQKWGRIRPDRVTEFLLMDQIFPRSICHCLLTVRDSLHAVTGTPVGMHQNRAERLLGQLCAKMAYLEMEPVFEEGLHAFIDRIQIELNTLSELLGEQFFGYAPKPQQQQQRSGQE